VVRLDATSAAAAASPANLPVPQQSSASPWAATEDWALLDRAADFTVRSETTTVTFWHTLVSCVPELSARSASECQVRLAELAAEAESGASSSTSGRDGGPAIDVSGGSGGGSKLHAVSVPLVGPQPPVLDEWELLEDGRYGGHVSGQSSYIWLSANLAGRLKAADPLGLDEQGYIEASGGQIYELGTKSLSTDAVVDLSSSSAMAVDGGSLVQAAQHAGRLAGPALLSGGVLIAASAAAYMFFGHHHVDVSVFIV